MMSPSASSEKKQALITALQWGLVQAFLLDTLGRFFQNYYRATTDAFGSPSWVVSVQFVAPLGLLIGGVGGYRRTINGRAATSASAHRKRVVFVGSLLAGWALAIVPTLGFQWMLGDQLFTVPFFVLPTLVAVSVFAGSYLLAYRIETEWYRHHRNRLLGAIGGAFAGMILGFIGFIAYGSYLAATQTNYNLSGGPGVVLAVCLGAIAGYILTDTEDSGDRAAEFLILFVLSFFAVSLVTALGVAALNAVEVSLFGFPLSFILPLVPIVVALGISIQLAYRTQTTFHQRLVGR